MKFPGQTDEKALADLEGLPTGTGMSLTWGSTAGTTCVIDFNTHWKNTPICVSQLASTTPSSYVSAATTSSITVTTGSNSKSVGMNVICQGYE